VPAAADRRTDAPPWNSKSHERANPPRSGFALLLTIGVIDSATRMGFLTFLPFLLRAKGAGLPEIGVALTLIFAGGAAGKLVCGFLGARLIVSKISKEYRPKPVIVKLRNAAGEVGGSIAHDASL
jgi:hypothetical protein